MNKMLICEECGSVMHQFSDSACLECPVCKSVYHIGNLMYPKGYKMFDSEESAIVFLQTLLEYNHE